MTTQREMAMAYTAQQQVIAALRSIGEVDLATRLEHCMTARRERHNGDGWPRTCRTAACVWCRRSMMHGWWAGMRDWSAATAVEPCDHPDTFADRPARSRVSDATRVARCQGPNGAAQKAMA